MANDDEIKRLVASGDKPDRLFARTVIYRDTTNVTATTTETASQGTCVNQIEGAGRPIQFAAQ